MPKKAENTMINVTSSIPTSKQCALKLLNTSQETLKYLLNSQSLYVSITRTGNELNIGRSSVKESAVTNKTIGDSVIV